MKINNTIENEEGNKVTFEGELSGTELAYVLQTGLNFLMYANLLPTVVKKPDNEELHWNTNLHFGLHLSWVI